MATTITYAANAITVSVSTLAIPHMGRFDSVSMADAITARELARSIGDEAPVLDVLITSIGSTLSDTTNLADTLTGDFTAAPFADTAAVADGSAVLLSRAVADSVTMADVVDASRSTTYADSATLSENTAFSTAKGEADTATTTDASSSTLQVVKADTATAAETVTLTLSMVYADAVTTSEAASPVLASTPNTWNPSDKSAAITLSGSNLIATGGSVSDQGVRGTEGRASGKKYFELKYTTHAGGNAQLGLSPSTHAIGTAPSAGVCAAVTRSSGELVISGATVATLGAYVAGDVVCIAIDFGADLIWARINNGQWNASGTADPATGTGGKSTAALAATLFPHAYYFNGNGNVTTGNFGASAFAYTMPSGFATWN